MRTIKQGHPPGLKEKFRQPDGWHWDFIENNKGQHLRCGWTIPDNPKGFIVIAPGLTEICEKYYETIRDLKKEGYAVAVLEWRGHGLSWRHLKQRNKRTSDGFENDVADFDIFMQKIGTLQKENKLDDKPLILLAHSMGANITLRYMHDSPERFSSAAFSSPMFDINLTTFQRSIAGPITSTFNMFGLLDLFAPGQAPWTAERYETYKHKLSHFDERRTLLSQWFQWDNNLISGGVTYRWLSEALASSKIIQQPSFLSAIKTPILIALTEEDEVVDNKATAEAAKHLPKALLKRYPNVRHEILMENDQERNKFLKDFKDFNLKP